MAGSEVAANGPGSDDPVDSATVIDYAENLSGQMTTPDDPGWYYLTPDVQWCFNNPSGAFPGVLQSMDYGTSTGPCSGGQTTPGPTPTSYLPSDSAALAPVSLTPAPEIDSPAPAAGYVQSTKPTLSKAKLSSYVTSIASAENATAAVSTVGSTQVYHTALSAAAVAMGQTLGASQGSSGAVTSITTGMQNWLDSDVDLLVLHGQFTDETAPRPAGAPAPTGTVLDVVLDAHSGAVDGTRLTSVAPATTAALGAGTSLK